MTLAISEMIDPATRRSPSHRNDGSGRTKNSAAEMAARIQVWMRRLRTPRPDRSEFCPSTGASSATSRPETAVEIASAVEVVLVEPKLSLVRYTAKTKVVMTVLKGWEPQSHMAQPRIRLRPPWPSARRAVVGSAGLVTSVTW